MVYKGNIKSRGISKVSSCDYHYWLLQLSKFQNHINITIFPFFFYSKTHTIFFSLFPFELFIRFYICNLQNFLSDNAYLSNLLLLNTDSRGSIKQSIDISRIKRTSQSSTFFSRYAPKIPVRQEAFPLYFLYCSQPFMRHRSTV